MARYDPHRGINTLLIEKISAASADQRAGRAGRTAPGVCVRLWTEREHARRPAQELPEVKRLDLAEVVLTLKAAGIDDVRGFPWLEKPDPKIAGAGGGAAGRIWGGCAGGSPSLGPRQGGDPAGRSAGGIAAPPRRPRRRPLIPRRASPSSGRKMLRFPVHPRYARMFLAAHDRGCVRPVALMAALTQGRSFLLRGAGTGGGGAARGNARRGARVGFLPADARVALCGPRGLFARRLPPPRHPRPGGAAGRAAVRAVPRDRGRRGARRRRSGGSTRRRCANACWRGFPTTWRGGSTAARCAANSCTAGAASSRGRAASSRRRCSSRPRSARSRRGEK